MKETKQKTVSNLQPVLNRQNALIWWKLLKFNEKLHYWRNYQKVTFTPSSSPDCLTGREIEQIYHNEKIELQLQENWQSSQSKKYNNKQFKEFSSLLFESYISKFSGDDKRSIFKIMLKEMQKQIIGYINVYDNNYEPAISESEAFTLLSSFGISYTHTNNKFIPFPENKTLFDMLKTPIEFYNWTKENLK